jgi:hypothetical protein
MIRSSGILPLFLLVGSAAAITQPHPQLVTTTVKPDKETIVTIRHVDEDKYDIGSSDTTPPILITVRYKGHDYPQMTLTGGKDFPPWGVRAAFARDLNGDGQKETIIGSFCHFGGSGAARYMTILSGTGASARLFTLPRGEAENIHDSTFFLLKNKNGQTGIAITHPMMDGETRADPTHWRVVTYRLTFPKPGSSETVKTILLGEKKTTKRYSEMLPDAIAAQQIPTGWKIIAPLL